MTSIKYVLIFPFLVTGLISSLFITLILNEEELQALDQWFGVE